MTAHRRLDVLYRPKMETQDERTEIFRQGETSSTHTFSPDLDEHVPRWRPPWWQRLPKRYLLAVMAFLGFCNVYILRANLSVAIVAMVGNVSIVKNGTVIYEPAEFPWDTPLQGVILAAFFYGYIVTQIPGGWLSGHFGGKRVFGLGVMVTAVLTLLTPAAARISVYTLIFVRVLEGLAEGVAYPAIHAMWTHWAPPPEKTRLATVAFSGSYIGMMVAFPLSGLLAQHFGWATIFYFTGTTALIWWILWLYIVRETPDQHETISRQELDYIQASIGVTVDQTKYLKPPWGHIATSPAMWAIILAHFSENWGFYTLLTGLPTYLKDVLHFKLEKAGFLAAMPYLVLAVCLQIGGQLSDWIMGKGYLTTTQVRKLFNCGGMLLQTVFMLGAAFVTNASGAMTCLTIALGLGGFVWCAFGVNHLDIAPQYASLLMGVSNCIATIPGIVSPIISGHIVVHRSAAEWQTVFFIVSGVYLGGSIFYGLFASGERQKWAEMRVGYSAYSDTQSAENVPFGNE